jgi:hypothetical protein
MSRIVKVAGYVQSKSPEENRPLGEQLAQVQRGSGQFEVGTFHRKGDAKNDGNQGGFGGGNSEIPTDNFVAMVVGGYDKSPNAGTFNRGTTLRPTWNKNYANLKKTLTVPNEDMATESVTLNSGKTVSEREWISSRQTLAHLQHRPVDMNHELGKQFTMNKIAQAIRV